MHPAVILVLGVSVALAQISEDTVYTEPCVGIDPQLQVIPVAWYRCVAMDTHTIYK